MDEMYAEEYRQLLREVTDRPELPIVFNVNIGHAMPRCIMPFGVPATVDAEKQVIRFTDSFPSGRAIAGSPERIPADAYNRRTN